MATLKISDLSVGDWVRWKVDDKTYDMQVSGVTDRRIYGLHDGIEYSMLLTQICPIPITAEILEKNGWVFHKGSLWWVCDIDKDTRTSVWLGKNSECRVEVSVLYGESRTWSNYADVKLANAHIHLLQRTLRLAGVEKEINL